MEKEARTDAPAQRSSAASPNLGVKLLWVAWLAIGLGIAMEGLLLLLGAGLGKSLGLGSIVADLVGNVSWSVFVCGGRDGRREGARAGYGPSRPLDRPLRVRGLSHAT